MARGLLGLSVTRTLSPGGARMTKKFFAAVALSTAPLLWPLAASAGILLTANGTTICTGPSGTVCINGSTTLADGVVVSGGSANSNSPGTATGTGAGLFSSTLTITNPGGNGTPNGTVF